MKKIIIITIILLASLNIFANNNDTINSINSIKIITLNYNQINDYSLAKEIVNELIINYNNDTSSMDEEYPDKANRVFAVSVLSCMYSYMQDTTNNQKSLEDFWNYYYDIYLETDEYYNNLDAYYNK
jgi:hypothetical protein